VAIDWLVYGRALSVMQVTGVGLMTAALVGIRSRA